MKTITHRYVRMEQMNHHGSLYGGTLTDWMTEAAFLGIAKEIGRKDHVVMRAVQELQFLLPVELGAILDLRYEIVKVGNSSLDVAVEAVDLFEKEKCYCTCRVSFVNTGEDGRSCPHGFSMANFSKIREDSPLK